VSRSDKEHREAEVAARRARRLADRAEQRAERKGEQARRAAERADMLAQRAKRQSPRDREIDGSIEDYVDDVADKWSAKAEDWIERNARKMFDESSTDETANNSYKDRQGYFDDDVYDEEHIDNHNDNHNDTPESKSRKRKGSSAMKRDRGDSNATANEAQRLAEKARKTADAAERLARASASGDLNSRRSRRSRRRASSRAGRISVEGAFSAWKRKSWKRRGYGFYYDDKNKKICGVCAGTAEYLGVETWQVRLVAVLGLIFAGSFMVPAYFITYFLMDKKPYYRQANDRYEAEHDLHEDVPSMRKRKSSQSKTNSTAPLPAGSLKVAKKKFMDIEARLRSMESHVTSSRFELQREIKKISGED
jgi:phage shock protein C